MPPFHSPQAVLPDELQIQPQNDRSSVQLPHDVAERFGQRLKSLRRERRMTQMQMAKIFGLDRSFIIDIECGRKSATLRTLEIIALGMELSLSDLLRGL